VEKDINAFWNQEVVDKGKLDYIYNGRVCCLNEFKLINNQLELTLGETDYKHLLFSNNQEKMANPGQKYEFNPAVLGVSVILISLHQKVILIQRSSQVGEFPECMDVPGGHIEPDKHLVDGVPDPFLAIAQELQEEIGIESISPSEIVCIGIIETTANRKPEMVFTYQSNQSSEAIIKLAEKQRSTEIEAFATIPNNLFDLNFYLESNKEQLSPSAFGCLSLYQDTFEK